MVVDRNRGTTVSIVTRLWDGDRSSITGRGRDFSRCHRIQKASGVSQPVTLSPWQSGWSVNLFQHPSGVEVKNVWSVSPTTLYAFNIHRRKHIMLRISYISRLAFT
jgi:hypothetical protein